MSALDTSRSKGNLLVVEPFLQTKSIVMSTEFDISDPLMSKLANSGPTITAKVWAPFTLPVHFMLRESDMLEFDIHAHSGGNLSDILICRPLNANQPINWTFTI